MSVNEKIEQALKGVTASIWLLVCPEERKPNEYIVYNPVLEEALSYADDEDQEWVQYMQVHLFAKGNYTRKRKEIRRRLRTAGFVVTDIDIMYENDTGYYHLAFSCHIEEEGVQ